MTVKVDGINGLTFADNSTQNVTALNASNITAGTLAKARMATGSVLQVVQATNSTNYAGTSGAEAAIFNFSITPLYSSSKIHALVSVAYGVYGSVANYATWIRLRRGTTTSGTEIAKVRFGRYDGGGTGTIREMFGTVVLIGLDSPATTSTQSYCVTNENIDGAPTYYINNASTQTNIILMEIAA